MFLESGFCGEVLVRFLDDRPAKEDYSIIAEGYTVADINLGYGWSKIYSSLQVLNLFDVAWNETPLATFSRLQNKPTPVQDIHFTPGTPFFL